MIALYWGGYPSPKARIWLDTLPHCDDEASEVMWRQQKAQPLGSTRESGAAVELCLPTGGMIRYGLLGALFLPDGSDQLVIRVPFSKREGLPFSDSLASRLDTVWKGLPDEFAESVLHSSLNTDTIQSLGAGKLRFCCAAHGELGSSIWIFSALSRIVVKLLCIDRKVVSEENLLKLVQNEIRF